MASLTLSAYTDPRRGTSSSVTAGAELAFETLVAIPGEDAPLRASLDDTLIRVIDGIVLLTVDGAERLLYAGDEAIVPGGAPHRLGAAGEARILSGTRPARG
jgi:quercetin dioxygenase-like cupin family protein